MTRLMLVLVGLCVMYLGHDLIAVKASLVESLPARDSLVDRGLFLHAAGFVSFLIGVFKP